MAREPEHAALFAVSEGLLDHDEAFAKWRNHHVLMVEREIGAKTGTGGSGVEYLRSTLDKRFFPELWGLARSSRESYERFAGDVSGPILRPLAESSMRVASRRSRVSGRFALITQ